MSEVQKHKYDNQSSAAEARQFVDAVYQPEVLENQASQPVKEPAHLKKKFESVVNTKSAKTADLANTVHNAASANLINKASTPDRAAIPKRLHEHHNSQQNQSMFQSAIGTRNAQPSLKQRITENSASMAIRRQGAASATDIQQTSGKVPAHERSVQKHRNSVAKKQLNTANNVSV